MIDFSTTVEIDYGAYISFLTLLEMTDWFVKIIGF